MVSRKSIYIIFVAHIITLTFQINQTCTKNARPTTCPINSFCNQKQYCECKQGWVLGCNIPAITLTQAVQTVDISSVKYFTIVPSSTDSIFVYRFEIATDVTTQLNIQLFADEGTQTELTKDNLIGLLTIQTGNQLIPLFSPYMEFGQQPNGKIQQMILKVEQLNSKLLENLTKAQGETPIEAKPVNLMIKVDEIYFFNKGALFAVVISFIGFVTLTLLCGIGYCVYTIRRGPRRFIDNNINFFDKLIPKRKLKANDQLLQSTCPVCLLDFEINDEVRETPCHHAFHPDCLDVWCKKNLTCPACRSNLSKSCLEEQLKKNNQHILLTRYSSNTTVDVEQLESDRQDRLRQPLQLN